LDNPIEFLGDAFQGDIEIAGKRIPKIALVGGGAALVVVLVLLSKRGGSASRAVNGALSGDASGVGGTTPFGGETPSGGYDSGTGTEALQSLQETFAQQLADQSSSLSDLIAQNSAQQASDLNSQLSSVYDQLANVGSSFSGGYSDQYTPIPMDTSYAMPLDSGIQAYPIDSGYSIASYLPGVTSAGQNRVNAALDKIKPSKVKPRGEKKADRPTLGTALKPSKGTDDLLKKLTSAPKRQMALSGVLGFDKKEPGGGKPGKAGVLGFDKKPGKTQETINSPVPVLKPAKKKTGGMQPSASPYGIGQKPMGIPTTIKTTLFSGISKTGKIPQATKPAAIKQPSKGVYGGGSGGAQPKPKVKIAPFSSYPRPAPIPVYRPYIPTYVNMFRPNGSYGKITKQTYKKGK